MEEGQEGEMGLWDGKFQVPQGIVRTQEMDIVDTMERQFTSGKQDMSPKWEFRVGKCRHFLVYKACNSTWGKLRM